METVTVVGAGMAGAACAAELHRAGRAVRLIERGRAPGGRMASPLVHGRRVDLGAGYFTVRDEGFRAVVENWRRRGLARPWTDTFAVRRAGPRRRRRPGRCAGRRRAVCAPWSERYSTDCRSRPNRSWTCCRTAPVVLAMPDVQAARLVAVADAVENRPTIAVACGYAERCWPFADAAFVRDHPDVTFVADDGARRGDGASVLVAHTTPERAARHLDDPDQAIGPVSTRCTNCSASANRSGPSPTAGPSPSRRVSTTRRSASSPWTGARSASPVINGVPADHPGWRARGAPAPTWPAP